MWDNHLNKIDEQKYASLDGTNNDEEMFTIATNVFTSIKRCLDRRLTDILPLIDSYIKLDMLCMASLMGIFRQIIFPNSRIEIIAMLKENRFFIIREASTLNIYKQSATNAVTISENLSNKENIIETSVNDAYFLVMTDQDLNTKKTFCLIARRTSSEFMGKCNNDVTELKFDY